MSAKNQLKELQEMINLADEQMQMFYGMMVDVGESKGINTNILANLERIASAGVNENIMDTLSDEELLSIMKANDESDYTVFVDWYNSLEGDVFNIEAQLRNSLKDTFVEVLQYTNLKKEKLAMADEVKVVQDNYISYINSDEYKAEKSKKMETLKEEIASCENESDKIRLTNEVKFYESLESFDYIFDRLNENPKEEAKRITDQFFNKSKSEYVIDRYTKRLKTLGLGKSIHRTLFNIEEKFLPEEYHAFNNLFLFAMMRTIAYTDVYSNEGKVNVKNIFRRLHNLVYHENETNEINQTKDIIITYLDFFKDMKDTFIENNVTYPNHPSRIERDKDHEQRRRMMLIAAIENLGLEAKSDQETEVLELQLREAEEALKQQKEEVIDNIINNNPPAPTLLIEDDTELQPDTIDLEDQPEEGEEVYGFNDDEHDESSENTDEVEDVVGE